MDEVFLKGDKKTLSIRERDIKMKMIEQKCMQTQTSSSDSGLAAGLVLPNSSIVKIPQLSIVNSKLIDAAKIYKELDQDELFVKRP